MSKEVVFDVRRITKELDELEPGLKKQMVREFKTVARPMADDIAKEVRSISPLSGMTHSGRTNWANGRYKNTQMRSDNVLIRYRQNRSRRSKVTSLVSIWLRSPMPSIVGVAGKGSGVPRSTQTKDYAWKGMTRRHSLNGQGRALIGQVRSHGWFNFFYKAAESQMPDTEREVKLIWEKYSAKVSRRL